MTPEPRLRDMPIRDAAATLIIFLPIVALLALGNRVADWLYDRGVGRENPDAAYARGYRKGVEEQGERIDALRDQLGIEIRSRDEWEANAEEAQDVIEKVRKYAEAVTVEPFTRTAFHVLRILDGGE